MDLAKRTLIRASKVEALPEARRGSGAVVEAVSSPDLLEYKSRDHEKKGLFSGPISLRAAHPPTLPKGEKGEQGWFGNKQTALYHNCKGAVRLKYQRLLSVS